MLPFALGIDIGGTRIKSASFDLASGRQLHSALLPTNDGTTAPDGSPAFAHTVRQLLAHHQDKLGTPASAIGISAPGIALADGSAISSNPGKLAGLEGLAWSDYLDHPQVLTLNDAHSALLGELWQGAAKGLSDVVLLTLGTGVGGAITIGGRLFKGHSGRAGHIGHMSLDPWGAPDICQAPGSLELSLGNATVAARSGGRFPCTHDLIHALRDGDPLAEFVWSRSIDSLGAAIVSLINLFDPQLILIGGGIGEAWPDIAPRLERYLDVYEWRPNPPHGVPIRRAELGEWAGCYGAAAAAARLLPA
jgi:glucokinase